MFKKGQKKIDIAKVFDINRCIITNIIKWFQKPENIKTVLQTGRLRKTSLKLDGRNARFSKNNPFYTASKIKNQLGLEDISSRIINHCLNENNLFAREACEKTIYFKEE